MFRIIDNSIDVRANYASVHIVKALLLIGSGKCGRERLMKELALNEAPARTMLRNLEKNGMIKPSYQGSVLSPKGGKFIEALNRKVSGPAKVMKTGITMSDCNTAYLVRNAARKIRKGVEQRDQAILMGAEGLTTLVFRKRLFMPGLEKWKVPIEISSMFEPKEGDVILIGSAKNAIKTDLAALNAAIGLLR